MRLPRQNSSFRKFRDRGNVLTATNFCVEISDRARAATARVSKNTAGETPSYCGGSDGTRARDLLHDRQAF
jgi:hypothetical protein